jgi:hypothetical protein
MIASAFRPAAFKSAPQHWGWAKGLTRIPTAALRHLPPLSLELASLLGDHEGPKRSEGWRRVFYQDVCLKTGLSRKQVQRRLRAMREVGLIETRAQPYRWGVVYELSSAQVLNGGTGTAVYVRQVASIMPAWGEVVVYGTKEHRVSLEKRPKRGRPKKEKASSDEPSEAPKGRRKEGNSVRHSYTVNGNVDPLASGSPSGNSGPQDGPPAPAGVGSRSRSEGEPDLARLDGILAGQPKPAPAGPRPNVPDLDRPRKVDSEGTYDLIPEHAPPGIRVRMLVDGYNAAARAVLGPGAPVAFARGDVARSKHYPALLKAADAMCEHSIAPQGWAEWRLSWAKSKGIKMGPARVFQAGAVEKRRGMYRREVGMQWGWQYAPEQWHFEQLFRAREAVARWQAGTPAGAACPIAAEPWYHEMRRGELRRGISDPLYNWPTPHGPRRRRKAVP